jgi:hypothetical protein
MPDELLYGPSLSATHYDRFGLVISGYNPAEQTIILVYNSKNVKWGKVNIDYGQFMFVGTKVFMRKEDKNRCYVILLGGINPNDLTDR